MCCCALFTGQSHTIYWCHVSCIHTHAYTDTLKIILKNGAQYVLISTYLSYVSHDSFICVSWLIHTCAMPRWYASFKCVLSPLHMCDVVCDISHLYACRDSFMCGMTHSYVWHDSFICVTWLIHMCDIPHSHACCDSFICEAWLVDMREMTHAYLWRDSFIREIWLIYIQQICQKTIVNLKRVFQKRPIYANQPIGALPTTRLRAAGEKTTFKRLSFVSSSTRDIFTRDVTDSRATWRIHMCRDLFVCRVIFMYDARLVNIQQVISAKPIGALADVQYAAATKIQVRNGSRHLWIRRGTCDTRTHTHTWTHTLEYIHTRTYTHAHTHLCAHLHPRTQR